MKNLQLKKTILFVSFLLIFHMTIRGSLAECSAACGAPCSTVDTLRECVGGVCLHGLCCTKMEDTGQFGIQNCWRDSACEDQETTMYGCHVSSLDKILPYVPPQAGPSFWDSLFVLVSTPEGLGFCTAVGGSAVLCGLTAGYCARKKIKKGVTWMRESFKAISSRLYGGGYTDEEKGETLKDELRKNDVGKDEGYSTDNPFRDSEEE